MSRLVIVSNRVADLRATTQSGGLAVGLADALKERGGIWFGWNGEMAETLAEEAICDDIGNVQTISAPLTEKDYREYYIGYSNSVLWPMFHYRLDIVSYKPAFFTGYCRVNEYFASLLTSHLKPEDVIWVHDYHLLPMARALRKRGCRQRIGFFLHIPFPPPDLLAASSHHKFLIESLLSYDVIGFQTSTDVANFKRYVEDQGLATFDADGKASYRGRTIHAERFPIGIDVDSFREMARQTAEDVQIDSMRRAILGQQQVIGVDRLDYSKGLPGRMEAFGRLLSQHPELEKAVTLLQIAPPTREDVDAYADIRAELESLSGSINGRFADFNWTPIRYMHRSVPRERLAALFRASHVGLVTPLRDGMNLVAKEYVAAQSDEDPGVLVLSQFAGAAEEMLEALIVNPYDVDDMARKLFEALTMPLEERRERQTALLRRIREHDAKGWLTRFLEALEAAPRVGAAEPTVVVDNASAA